MKLQRAQVRAFFADRLGLTVREVVVMPKLAEVGGAGMQLCLNVERLHSGASTIHLQLLCV